MDTIHKQEFNVRDLGTRAVTLFPSSAQVVREVKNVSLHPGTNEITVFGLTPTVDEESVKVEGTGSAVISDIAVELLPNRDIFEECHPEFDQDETDADDDSDTEPDAFRTEFGSSSSRDDNSNPELQAVRENMQRLRDQQKNANELLLSAASRLKILDAYTTQLDRRTPVDMTDLMATYRAEREKVFQDHMEGTLKERDLSQQLNSLIAEEKRLVARRDAEARKAARKKQQEAKAKQKELDRKNRRKAEHRREKARLRGECERFWPRSCYAVRITLDAGNFTPLSSRRSSLAGEAAFVKPSQSPSQEFGVAASAAAAAGLADDETSAGLQCDLVLTYVTHSAFWSPSYDLQLSTTTNSAALCFDAQLTNTTSETWSGCKVTLSTSQATFSGLNDAIPTLKPWRIKLAPRFVLNNTSTSDLANSREEIEQKRKVNAAQSQAAAPLKSRRSLFGWPKNAGVKEKQGARPPPPIPTGLAPPPPPLPSGGALFGASRPVPTATSSRAFGASVPFSAPPPPPAAEGSSMSRAEFATSDFGGSRDEDENTILNFPRPELEFQESLVEETGLTTTYDLPGVKTLAPRSTATKQRMVRLQLSNVAFSHTIVAKYKPVAYIQARLCNSSTIALLRGPASLTLDGSFMGRTSLPRCSPGESFTLSLGVDPGVKVTYPKPEIRRTKAGLFGGQDNALYTRVAIISNTRAAGKPVQMKVLDQVPVSEDDKVRVEVLRPRPNGLAGAGASTGAGTGVVPYGPPGDWGKATASLKKDGEVGWDVTLNPGKTVKLELEYTIAVPPNECATEC
ncbi:hypothetical protein SODALDRAFT_318729 [Sodiomyces alkalinus F11]|uniref:Mucoidy inhibitor A n=1 Tax=Sodiomyces alkalinus (strain CBS 110278 / VKM F-3762 / F11) TaxID=1314773 RepID=A0A3N2Q581_SODAK|nr:hypothetical protein SODALDRAFT_318729 [Sodiomyces alkalinus F11]ROT41934.1 hypothetical protein SODALDRAFT_318729 [Sodiomyces alkalinus F11]